MGVFSALIGNAGTVDPETIIEKYEKFLIEGETVEIGFKLVRDILIFTDRRLIAVDKQGVTGKKVEILSIPYRSISRFSLETAGHFDLESELKIWISSAVQPSMERTFSRSVDVYALHRVLASHVV